MKLINDRKSGKTTNYKASNSERDLLDLLIEDEFYSEHLPRLVDDIILMFIAGMETIQMSTTNLVQHLTINPDMKKRLIEETEPIIAKAENTGIVSSLSWDDLEQFNFTRNCFYESLELSLPPLFQVQRASLKTLKLARSRFRKTWDSFCFSG